MTRSASEIRRAFVSSTLGGRHWIGSQQGRVKRLGSGRCRRRHCLRMGEFLFLGERMLLLPLLLLDR